MMVVFQKSKRGRMGTLFVTAVKRRGELWAFLDKKRSYTSNIDIYIRFCSIYIYIYIYIYSSLTTFFSYNLFFSFSFFFEKIF